MKIALLFGMILLGLFAFIVVGKDLRKKGQDRRQQSRREIAAEVDPDADRRDSDGRRHDSRRRTDHA